MCQVLYLQPHLFYKTLQGGSTIIPILRKRGMTCREIQDTFQEDALSPGAQQFPVVWGGYHIPSLCSAQKQSGRIEEQS
jgi:hypothetical protein